MNENKKKNLYVLVFYSQTDITCFNYISKSQEIDRYCLFIYLDGFIYNNINNNHWTVVKLPNCHGYKKKCLYGHRSNKIYINCNTSTTSLQKCQIKLFSNGYNNSNIILIRYRSDYTIPFTFTTPSLRPNDNSFVVSIARFQFNDIRRNVNH